MMEDLCRQKLLPNVRDVIFSGFPLTDEQVCYLGGLFDGYYSLQTFHLHNCEQMSCDIFQYLVNLNFEIVACMARYNWTPPRKNAAQFASGGKFPNQHFINCSS